jgi:hypothetical protein
MTFQHPADPEHLRGDPDLQFRLQRVAAPLAHLDLQDDEYKVPLPKVWCFLVLCRSVGFLTTPSMKLDMCIYVCTYITCDMANLIVIADI